MNTRLDLIKDDLFDILLLINGELVKASGVFTELLLLVTYMLSLFFFAQLRERVETFELSKNLKKTARFYCKTVARDCARIAFKASASIQRKGKGK
jgi:hypothetical protein